MGQRGVLNWLDRPENGEARVRLSSEGLDTAPGEFSVPELSFIPSHRIPHEAAVILFQAVLTFIVITAKVEIL